MANVLQPIGTDASGYEVLTAAIRELLNQYPGLPQGERIKFEELEKDKGIAFSADSGALIYEENEDREHLSNLSVSVLCCIPDGIRSRTT